MLFRNCQWISIYSVSFLLNDLNNRYTEWYNICRLNSYYIICCTPEIFDIISIQTNSHSRSYVYLPLFNLALTLLLSHSLSLSLPFFLLTFYHSLSLVIFYVYNLSSHHSTLTTPVHFEQPTSFHNFLP